QWRNTGLQQGFVLANSSVTKAFCEIKCCAKCLRIASLHESQTAARNCAVKKLCDAGLMLRYVSLHCITPLVQDCCKELCCETTL
ncbi:Hypothetical protein FKW44_005287, partial [Caligus rogercresseyi]